MSEDTSKWRKLVDWALLTLQKKLVWVILLLSLAHNVWGEYKLNRAAKALLESQKYIQDYSENRRREDEEDKKAWRESYFIMLQIFPYFNNAKDQKDSIVFPVSPKSDRN